MIIGTVRAEKARVFDSEAGYHSFHNEDGEEYGSFEVYWEESGPQYEDDEGHNHIEPGWYWFACFPGCMPDSEPSGPFATSREARQDADENWDG